MKLRLRKPKWDEKRRSQRLDLEGGVTWNMRRKAFGIFHRWGEDHSGIMMKPSAVGIRLSTEAAIPAGSVLTMKIDMEKWGESNSLTLRGEVVWSERSPKSGRFDHGIRLWDGKLDHQSWEKFIFEKLREFDHDHRVLDFGG